jgi:hypothetical protein
MQLKVRYSIELQNDNREKGNGDGTLNKGFKGYQIANELNVDPATISRDMQYLSKASRLAMKTE